MFELLCNGDEIFRAALIEAAKDPEARVRVAAIGGLAKLKRDDATEAILRAAWTNPKEAYGARKAALRGLVAWKVKDADELLADALKVTADHHSIAATALELMLETPGAKARELAALYSKYGQPAVAAIHGHRRVSALAKDDPALQDILVELADDHRPLRAVSGLDGRARARSEEGPAGARGPARPREPRLRRLHAPHARRGDRCAEGTAGPKPRSETPPRPNRPRPSPSSRARPPTSSSRPRSSEAGSPPSSSRPSKADRPPRARPATATSDAIALIAGRARCVQAVSSLEDLSNPFRDDPMLVVAQGPDRDPQPALAFGQDGDRRIAVAQPADDLLGR